MDINKILNHPAVKRSEIARRLYPDLSLNVANSKLNKKISGKNYRRILPFEEEKIKLIWMDIKNEIEN
jgi:hypothetical protein